MNNQYENLNFGNGFISLEMLILAIFIGAVLAAFAAIYNKRILGNFVWLLLKSGINSKESAKTIYELNCQKNPFLRAALKNGSVLRRIVRSTEDDDTAELQLKEKGLRMPAMNLKTARFYIPEEMRIKAEIRYHRKGTDWVTFVLALVVFAAIALAIYYLLPELLTMLDNLISEIKPEPNYI